MRMCTRIRETIILEPVSSTSRRGARAAYHDEYPRDFGPRIAYTVSLVSDTSRPPIRQGGRDMSAPRPYETYPFHSPALFTLNTRINFYIYIQSCSSYFFHVVYSVHLSCTHALSQNHLLQGSEPFWKFSVFHTERILANWCKVHICVFAQLTKARTKAVSTRL